MALTPKQKIFADEYLIDLNATRAYKVAYPSCKKDDAAAVNGSKLLRNTKVAEYIQERMKERSKRTEITQDRVLQELEKLVLFDIRKLFDSNGKPVDISMLDDDTAACIAGLEVVDYFEGVNEPAGVLEVRQWITAILNDGEPCVKPEEAFRVTQILEAIYQASETNRTIQLG